MRAPRSRAALLALLVAGILVPARPALAFSDVPPDHWAATAITYVAQANPWMQDFGPEEFRPEELETRRLLARALVLAFAPEEPADPALVFSDLPPEDPFYPYANVAARLRWLPPQRSGAWSPDRPVSVREVDRALVRALARTSPEVRRALSGLSRVREADGDRYRFGEWFRFLQLGRWLGLHRNHGDDRLELRPTDRMRRDQVAYALWRAATVAPWKLAATRQFTDVTLPALDPGDPLQDAQRRLTRFALGYVGYPYVWAGEWRTRTSAGYCCGPQPQGGFDCSGFVWWVLKAAEDGYDAARFRSYAGWPLPERSSASMARATPSPVPFADLQPGDVMFFALNGGSTWRDVNHTAIYLGNGWMVHAASSVNGVTLERVGSGWYAERFLFGRRVLPVASPEPEPAPQPSPTPEPSPASEPSPTPGPSPTP
ncbi:MAG TPA: NlpC/P60 family protein [Actinomycetota bacterium]|nr:NlpC/P60 family protein [Actinomycetota bacterium]